MLHDLHILSVLGVPLYRPVSINKLCEEVRNLVSAILYFLSIFFRKARIIIKTSLINNPFSKDPLKSG